MALGEQQYLCLVGTPLLKTWNDDGR